MAYLHPWAIVVGVLAAGLPLAIHLLTRPRPIRLPLSTIRFVRDGKDLAIRPGNGDETGFKYLAGKQDCLIVIAGQEGYCR